MLRPNVCRAIPLEGFSLLALSSYQEERNTNLLVLIEMPRKKQAGNERGGDENEGIPSGVTCMLLVPFVTEQRES